MQVLFKKYGYFVVAVSLWVLPLIIGLTLHSGLVIEKFDSPDSIAVRYSHGSLEKIEFARELILINLKVCIALLSGIFLFGIPTVGVLIYNGFFSGALIKYFIDNELLTTTELLKTSAPHFAELIGLWLVGSIGLRGISWLRNLLVTDRFPDRESIIYSVKTVLIAALLIVISGFIEVYISVL